MAIKQHEIRAKEGGTRIIKNMTPLQEIRLQCVECMGFSIYEPVNCTSPLCSLFPYREGSTERKGSEASKKPFGGSKTVDSVVEHGFAH